MFNLAISMLIQVKLTLLGEMIFGLNNCTQDTSTYMATYSADSGKSMNLIEEYFARFSIILKNSYLQLQLFIFNILFLPCYF